MIYTFIAGHCSDLPVVACCRALKVSVSGFYEWQHRQCNPAPRTIANRELTETITEIWARSRGTYGSPRIWAELRLGQDLPISRKRVERLMRQAGIEGVYRRRRRHGTTKRDPQAVPPDDLVNRQFEVEGPDRLWVADITEHSSVEGKVYLAVVIDAWSRRVIGWSIADHLRTEIVVDALDMACWRRKPTPGEVIHHADHGSQYTSWAFGQRLRAAGLLGSMGTVGDALDNAMAESIIGLYKSELITMKGPWRTVDDVELATLTWVHWWNHKRLLEPIGNIPPAEHEPTGT